MCVCILTVLCMYCAVWCGVYCCISSEWNNAAKEWEVARRRRRHTLVPNLENPPKIKFTKGDFTSFSMQVSANSNNFRFRLPALHSKFVKPLQAQVWHVNLTNFFGSHFWRDFAIRLNCAPPARLPVLQPFLGQEEDKTKTRSNLYIDDHGLWAPCSPLG